MASRVRRGPPRLRRPLLSAMARGGRGPQSRRQCHAGRHRAAGPRRFALVGAAAASRVASAVAVSAGLPPDIALHLDGAASGPCMSESCPGRLAGEGPRAFAVRIDHQRPQDGGECDRRTPCRFGSWWSLGGWTSRDEALPAASARGQVPLSISSTGPHVAVTNTEGAYFQFR